MKLKWNRKCSIFVLFMFITVTFASFNTNLFIDGRAYVRAQDLVRITNIELVENTNQSYETYDPVFTKDSITINTNLPKQNSTAQYRITIQNNSDYDYDVQDIIEQTYSNNKISYNITGLTVDETVLEAHTTSTFLLTLSNNTTITEEPDVYETKTYTFDYTGNYQEFIAPYTGTYKMELWGAGGGDCWGIPGGKGGYVSGDITLKKGQLLYVYVGQRYDNQGASFNGSLNSSHSGRPGGGATDIRLIHSNKWYDFNSLKSRIIVAAGAGASSSNSGYPGADAGGLVGYTAVGPSGSCSIPGNQFSGGQQTCWDLGDAKGYFGRSGSSGAGGGSGWYAGSGGQHARGGGSGGSSYISGHKGCVSIQDSSTENNVIVSNDSNGVACNNTNSNGYNASGYNTDTQCSKHYSGYIFSNTVIIDGKGYAWDENGKAETSTGMPTHDGTSTMTGNAGNGYAKITMTRKIEDGSEYDFDYIGDEQTFTTPYTGVYQLETWGAEGTIAWNGTAGKGGYARGQINLNKNDQLFINVGGSTGYNGGNGVKSPYGGGATHVALETGIISTFENKLSKLLIVSGGGGGGERTTGGSGGGFKGGDGTYTSQYEAWGSGGTQSAGGIGREQTNYPQMRDLNGYFGIGGSNSASDPGSGGGGGLYGGGGTTYAGGGGGGSGYIGNTLLTNKIMYCYNCEESQAADTRTVSTNSSSQYAKSNQAKEGNGYSRITLVQRLSNNIELSLKFDIQRLTDYNITYDLDGGTISGQNNTYTRNSENFTLPTPTKVGYTFVGWTGGKNLYDITKIRRANDYLTTSSIDENYNFYVSSNETEKNKPTFAVIGPTFKYKANKTYTVSFDYEGYYNRVSLSTAAWGDTSSNFFTYNTNEFQFSVNEDLNLYFLFYVDSDAKDMTIYNLQIEEGNKKTAYEQYIATPTANINIQKGSRGNRIYTAVWEPIDYSIEYDLDGGTLANPITSYNGDSATFTLPTPTKEGYEFVGWEGGKNLFNYKVATTAKMDGATVSGWSIIDGGLRINSNVSSSCSYWYTSMGDLADYSGNTYTFMADGTASADNRARTLLSKASSNYSQRSYFKAMDNNARITFVPPDPDETYTKFIIGFYANACKTTESSSFYSDYTSIQLEKGDTNTGYEDYLYPAEETVTITKGTLGNRLYHAKWEPIQSEVTLNPNGGEVSSNSVIVSYGNHYSELPTPTRTGYTFAGWKLIPNELTSTEYIETNREGYINTGYYANDNTEYEISAQLLEGEAKDASLFGSRTGAGQSDAYVLWHNNIRGDHAECVSPVFAGQQRGSSDDVEYQTFIKHTMELRNKKFYLDGVEKYTFTATFPETNNYSLYLFGLNNGGTVDGRKYRGKLYYFQLIENGSTVRYYVPVVRKSDSTKGVYDLVNGRFFTLANTYEDYATTTITNNSLVTQTTNHTLIAMWSKNS